MARRGGKAANRKAKQRRMQRPATPPRTAAPASPADDAALAATDLAAEASAAIVPPARPAHEPARRVTRDPRQLVAGPSGLGERARQEYHYVQRDLRNIGVLVVIMAGLLAVAFVVFNVMGIARAG